MTKLIFNLILQVDTQISKIFIEHHCALVSKPSSSSLKACGDVFTNNYSRKSNIFEFWFHLDMSDTPITSFATTRSDFSIFTDR
jgi:hypothetical protein